jgi:hypothetical protein
VELVELRLGDQLRRIEGRTSGEDSEPAEKPLLVRAEQLVAPRDRRFECALPFRNVSHSTS